jgi:predicted nucleic acid-binding protein
VRYWDASALAPLALLEASTDRVRSWLAEDPVIVTWAWTRVELVGAVERRVREGRLTRVQRRDAIGELEVLWESWNEVTDVLAVRARATSLLARHPLRAADAGQLGAALLVAEQGSAGFTFVCLDQRLNEAAEREGLRVLPGTDE